MKAGAKTGKLLELSSQHQEISLGRLKLRNLEWLLLIGALILNDLILYNIAFRLAYWIRYESNWPITKYWFQPAIDYTHLSLLTIPVFIVIFAMVGLYNRKNLLGDAREYSLVFTATTMAMFINISVGFLFPDDMILARAWVILTWLLSLVLISMGRFIIRRVVYRLRYNGWFQSPALIVGSNSEAGLVTNQLSTAKNGGLKVVGYIHCGNGQLDVQENLPCFGQLEDLHATIHKYHIPVIILISSALTRDQVVEIFRKYGTAKHIDLRMSTGLYEIITTGLQVKEDGMVPLVAINNVRLTGTDRIFKFLLDYCLAIPAALLFIPFYFLIAILIKLDSPGPVIHFRRVMGVNGKQFNAYKFRTMYTDGDQILAKHPELMDEYEHSFKIKDDPRVTRLGKFLRKTSLDELPQIFNILKNQMSVVGPRMICPDELEKYNQWDINLLTVKPGLTGLSQIRGRSNLSYAERVHFDMYYIRNWTIWMDLQIIVQTIPVVLNHRGAY
jgi:exopolysaccharide biosynthesis polyprenyl glycosylphosphotransferase